MRGLSQLRVERLAEEPERTDFHGLFFSLFARCDLFRISFLYYRSAGVREVSIPVAIGVSYRGGEGEIGINEGGRVLLCFRGFNFENLTYNFDQLRPFYGQISFIYTFFETLKCVSQQFCIVWPRNLPSMRLEKDTTKRQNSFHTLHTKVLNFVYFFSRFFSLLPWDSARWRKREAR